MVRTIYFCEDKEPKIPSPQCPGSVSVVTVLEAEFWVAQLPRHHRAPHPCQVQLRERPLLSIVPRLALPLVQLGHKISLTGQPASQVAQRHAQSPDWQCTHHLV